MIYETVVQKRHFVIEWDRPEKWGARHETKWVASSHGAVLARGATAGAVLRALLSGKRMPTLDGVDPSTMDLPITLDGWSNAHATHRRASGAMRSAQTSQLANP